MIVLAIVFTAAAWLIFSVGPITKHFGGAPSIFAFGALETIRLQVVHASEASLNQFGGAVSRLNGVGKFFDI